MNLFVLWLWLYIKVSKALCQYYVYESGRIYKTHGAPRIMWYDKDVASSTSVACEKDKIRQDI